MDQRWLWRWKGADEVKYISETIESEKIHAVVFHEGEQRNGVLTWRLAGGDVRK